MKRDPKPDKAVKPKATGARRKPAAAKARAPSPSDPGPKIPPEVAASLTAASPAAILARLQSEVDAAAAASVPFNLDPWDVAARLMELGRRGRPFGAPELAGVSGEDKDVITIADRLTQQAIVFVRAAHGILEGREPPADVLAQLERCEPSPASRRRVRFVRSVAYVAGYDGLPPGALLRSLLGYVDVMEAGAVTDEAAAGWVDAWRRSRKGGRGRDAWGVLAKACRALNFGRVNPATLKKEWGDAVKRGETRDPWSASTK